MGLSEPRPIRRLDRGVGMTPRPRRDPPALALALASDTNVPDPDGRTGFVSARRPERNPVPTIERMRVQELSVTYGGKLAVNSVSFPIRQGEVLAMIGTPSGAKLDNV